MGRSEDDQGLEFVAETMKDLLSPRVELTRRQHQLLQQLSEKSGKTVKELVRRAVDRYLKDEGSK